jgi:hypothetical protein
MISVSSSSTSPPTKGSCSSAIMLRREDQVGESKTIALPDSVIGRKDSPVDVCYGKKVKRVAILIPSQHGTRGQHEGPPRISQSKE